MRQHGGKGVILLYCQFSHLFTVFTWGTQRLVDIDSSTDGLYVQQLLCFALFNLLAGVVYRSCFQCYYMATHSESIYSVCVHSNLVLYKEDIPASWTALFPHSCWYKSRILIVAHLNGFHPMLLHVYAKKLLRKPPSTCFSMRVLGSCFALVCQTWHACTEAQPEPVGLAEILYQ